MLNEVTAKITAQQTKKHTAVWAVGEQLKDILRGQPELAELVLQDLENKAMNLESCEAKIKERADALHKERRGQCICITPTEAEDIIRKFYGLPERASEAAAHPSPKAGAEVVILEDFF